MKSTSEQFLDPLANNPARHILVHLQSWTLITAMRESLPSCLETSVLRDCVAISKHHCSKRSPSCLQSSLLWDTTIYLSQNITALRLPNCLKISPKTTSLKTSLPWDTVCVWLFAMRHCLCLTVCHETLSVSDCLPWDTVSDCLPWDTVCVWLFR